MVNKSDYARFVLYCQNRYNGVTVDEQLLSGISQEDRDRYEQIVKDNLKRGFTVETLHLSSINPSGTPVSSDTPNPAPGRISRRKNTQDAAAKGAKPADTAKPAKPAGSNQYGKETFQKFTYSLNPNDPAALLMSKQIETVIRNVLEPLQPEDQRIQRTQRTYDDSGRRSTDYYIKSDHASTAQKAVDNFIQQQAAKRKTSIDAHVSNVTPATFRTQMAAILDARARADIGRIVSQNGGFFSTDKNGLSQWGVEDSLQTEGSKGKPVNLSASLSRRVSSANKEHRKKWEDLMAAATGQSIDYKDFSQEERDAMAKGAKPIVDRKNKIKNPELVKADIAAKTELSTLERKEKDKLIYTRPDLLPQNYIASTAQGRHDLKRIRDRQRRNLYTLEDEKEDTYARLAQAGRRGALIRQYEAEHPDDPRVAAKRVGEEKKERDIRQHKRRMFLRKTGLGAKRALSGTSRLIRANVRLALSTIITSLVAGLGIASKIYRSVTDIGDTVRRRAMSDAALNFDPGTIHAWEAYAGNRGWDKNALAHAASEVYGAFGNIENFSKTNLRLWTFLLGSGVGDLTSMLTNDGDANVETIMSAIMNRLIRNIDAGHASVVKPNVSPSQAYAEIVSQLSGLSPALGLMLSYYDSEFKLAQSKDRTITKYSDWKIKGSDGVLYDMSDWSNFYRVSQFDPVNKLPEMPDRPIKDTATQQANEQFTNAAGAFITLRDDLLQDIAINTVNTFNAVRSIISEFLRPFFPAFAAKEAERAAIINDQSRATLETMLPVWAGRAAVAAKEQGYTGDMTVLMDAVSQSLHKNTFDPLLNLGLEDTTLTGLLNNFDLLAAYAQGLNYQRQLDEQKNRDKRAILVTAELVSEAARSAVQQLFTIGGYRLKHEYSDKGSPYALDVDYVLNPEEARKRADDRAKQEEQERTRQAQIAEETGRKSAKLRDELVDASRVSMGMLEKEAGKAVKQGLVPRLTGGDSYDLMRHFNYIAGLAEKAISGPFAEHSINVNGGLVSMREYGYTNLLIPAIKKVMQSKAFTNYQLQGSEYASIINIVSDYINYFSSHDMEDMAEQFSAELYVPLLEFLAAMPRADEATRAAMKRIPIEPPGFIPERFREIIDNFWNTYSGAMALESYTRRQNASRQAGSILDSNVLTYRDLHQNGYEAVIANVISAHIGSVLAQVEDSNDISAVLSKYLGAAGEGNHVDVSSADNGSAILNIYLDNKLKYTTELKNMFERGVRFSKRIDTMYDLNGVKPTR